MTTEVLSKSNTQPVQKWNHRRNETSIEVVKKLADSHHGPSQFLGDALQTFYQDKGFNPEAVDFLKNDGSLGILMSRLVFRFYNTDTEHPNFSAFTNTSSPEIHAQYSYLGTDFENYDIDRAYSKGGNYSQRTHSNRIPEHFYGYNGDRVLEPIAGQGASRIFDSKELGLSDEVRDIFAKTPVTVLGAGAAGVLSAAGLKSIGFQDVTLLDKSDEIGGIWTQPNVRAGTINTPFRVSFNGITMESVTTSSPKNDRVDGGWRTVYGNRGSGRFPEGGEVINHFLNQVAKEYNLKPTKGKVKQIIPGDLHHTIDIDTPHGLTTINAPLVINALGAARALPPSHDGHMTTTTPEAAGKRWQKQFSDEELIKLSEKSSQGQHVVLIGAGNSTWEDVGAFQRFNRTSEQKINYMVLTHFRGGALIDPTRTTQLTQEPVPQNFDKASVDKRKDTSKYGSVFRDLSNSDLTGIAADVPWVNTAFETTLRSGRLLPDIVSWKKDGDYIVAVNNKGLEHKIPVSLVCTNIGFGNDPETVRNMGAIVTDEYRGSIAADYDGEIQSNPEEIGRNRLQPGYLAIGSLLKSVYRPNAQVIGGIQFNLPDLLFTSAMRAVEYNLQK